jgi:hypothetical protein
MGEAKAVTVKLRNGETDVKTCFKVTNNFETLLEGCTPIINDIVRDEIVKHYNFIYVSQDEDEICFSNQNGFETALE